MSGMKKVLEKLGLTTKCQVWSLDNVVTGFKWETWVHPEVRYVGTKADFETFWGGPVVGGIPTHLQGAPDTSGVETDLRFAQRELGYDGHRLTYCIDNREGTEDLVLEDTDARAESVRIYLGCECYSELVYERYQNPDGGANNPPYDSNGLPAVTVPAGEIKIMTVLIHDPGPDFSGFNPVILSGGPFISYSSKPEVNCRIIDDLICKPYVLLENESFKEIEFGCKGACVPNGWRCEEVCVVVGFVTVSQQGEVFATCGGAVVSKTGTGAYNITAPAGAETSNAWAIIGEPDNNNNNDVRAHFSSSFTTGDFHIEQQNGNGQWRDVDKPFTIQWYGKRKQVIC